MVIINKILDLGAVAIMPIIITVLGLLFGQKISKALRAGITIGIGFIGISMVTGLLSNNLSPVTQALAKEWHLSLNVTDVGWPVLSAISYGSPLVPLVFLVCILLNVVMIAFNLTKTMNVDLWNYWHFIYCGALIQFVTNNVILALIGAGLSFIVINKMADWTAPKMQEYTGIPGISFPHTDSLSWAPIGLGINWIIDRIPGVNKINFSSETIQKRFGIMGEPMMIGLILGFVLGLLAKYDIGNSFVLGMNMAGIMFILPRMIKILMEGLIPLSDSAKEFMEKRFPDKEIFIGLDGAVAIGKPEIISTGLIMVPITLILAVILPGNKILPFVDLATLPYFMIWAVVPSKGNMFRSIITGTIFVAIFLYCGTWLSPVITGLAEQINFDFPTGSNDISSVGAGAQGVPNIIYWVIEAVAKLFGLK